MENGEDYIPAVGMSFEVTDGEAAVTIARANLLFPRTPSRALLDTSDEMNQHVLFYLRKCHYALNYLFGYQRGRRRNEHLLISHTHQPLSKS